jgi:uncharacterized protein (TIGR03437 family)
MKRYAPFFSVLILLLALTSELFAQQWNTTGALNTARTDNTATALTNGKVLVVGGIITCAPRCQTTNTAELYDPATGVWSNAGTLPTGFATHAAARLLDGRVLVIGGVTNNGTLLRTSYLYDPATNNWTATGLMNVGRQYHTALLLPNGKVLVTGGLAPGVNDFIPTNVAELYDPATGTWSATGAMNVARYWHTMTLLPNGNVLVATGSPTSAFAPVKSCEIYNPQTGTWSLTGELAVPRTTPATAWLPNGKVLLAGGTDNNVSNNPINSAELYDPATGQWSATGNLLVARDGATAILLPNGKVFVAGGYTGGSVVLKSAELYDPATGLWSSAAEMSKARCVYTATLLPNGKVLVAAGAENYVSAIAITGAEIYDSGDPVAATVSGASYLFQIAPKEIVSAFGENFSAITDKATDTPLPTSLAGVTVKVKDSIGVERLSPLFFVSPTQINYQIPAGTALGQAVVTVTASNGRLHNGLIDVQSNAPSIFTTNQQGTGAAAALDAITFTGAPFNAMQANGQPNIIALFTTGLGADVTDADGNVNTSVEARIDGQVVTVQYAGRAPGFVGLNQINVHLPTGIASGTHTLTLSRNGALSNAVTIAIK